MSIEEFAEKFIEAENEAWKTGDYSALAELEDPDVVYHDSVVGDTVGREAHKEYILTARQAVSNLQQDWKFLAGEGNLLALSYKSRGVLMKEIPGLPLAVGKEYTTNYLFLLRLKDNKIVEAWDNGSFTLVD